MKKSVAIFLLTVYLFSATDLKELLKIEVVIEHLQEHQKNDRSVTLFQFLVMHYITDDGNSKDNATDEKLPFKSHEVYSVVSFVSVPNQIASLAFNAFPIIKDDFFVEDDSLIFTNYHALVWHPPQFS